MSILIKGMKMPPKCIECRLMRRCGKDDLDYVCMPARVYVEDLTNAYRPRPEYCPLIELPPHGRLIDADSLKETLDYYIREAGWSDEINEALTWVRDEFIDHEPTIIEAEEGE